MLRTIALTAVAVVALSSVSFGQAPTYSLNSGGTRHIPLPVRVDHDRADHFRADREHASHDRAPYALTGESAQRPTLEVVRLTAQSIVVRPAR